MFLDPFCELLTLINGRRVRRLRKNREKGTPPATNKRGQNTKASHLRIGKSDLDRPFLKGKIVRNLARPITQSQDIRLDLLNRIGDGGLARNGVGAWVD